MASRSIDHGVSVADGGCYFSFSRLECSNLKTVFERFLHHQLTVAASLLIGKMRDKKVGQEL